jgi:xanthine dehydrogenase accessory factor
VIGWLRTLQRLAGEGTAAVVVTVAGARGSAPREAGARMIVTAGEAYGTIGGGHLEHRSLAIARELIASGGGGAVHRFALGASLGQCCGGVVNLLFEPAGEAAPWLDTVAELQRDGVPCVLVRALRGGSRAGHLIVTAEGTRGSLGAALDTPARDFARATLADGGGPRVREFGAADARAALYFEPLRAADFHIALFGAGHVGKALVQVLSGLSCRITWVDSRDGEFPGAVPETVTVVCTDDPEAEVDAAAPGSFFLVMTHSHALDHDLAERILRRGDFAYFGLIGSLAKRRQFEKRMAARGVPAPRLAAMRCPIGVDGIDGKEPSSIAIAVAAELLRARECLATTTAAPVAARRA